MKRPSKPTLRQKQLMSAKRLNPANWLVIADKPGEKERGRSYMRTITIDQVMAWKSCHSKEEILEISGGRESMTVLEIFDLNISPKNVQWLLFREEVLPEKILHEFACWCAERALLLLREAGREPHPASWQAIETKRRWLNGKATDIDLEKASAAVWEISKPSCIEVCAAAAWAAEKTAVRSVAKIAEWAARAVARTAKSEIEWLVLKENEEKIQNEKLRQMIIEAEKEGIL